MNAEEMRRISMENGRKQAIDEQIKIIEERILEYAKEGRNCCHFATKEEYGGLRVNINGKSTELPEVRQYFIKKGFKFKDTGYNCGVYQHTEKICW